MLAALSGAAATIALAAPATGSAASSLSAPTFYKLPSPFSSPDGITVGPDGALWFTELDGKRIGRITTSGSISEVPLGAGAKPVDITTGADGNLWFTDDGSAPNVSRLTPTTHVLTPFALPGASEPQGIATGEDGNVWVAESGAESIASVTPGGTIAPVKTLFLGDHPSDVTPGHSGEAAIWYAAGTKHVGFHGFKGLDTEGTIPNEHAAAETITTGPNADFWFTETGPYLGHVGNIFGGVGEFPQVAAPTNVIAGPDGNLWWTNETESTIGRTLPDGLPLDSLRLAKTADPLDLVTGPDGAIWFTDAGENAIGRVAVPAPTPLPTGPQGPAGPTGPQGAAGPAGPSGHLVVVAFKTSVSKARVTISFALTDPARVALSVSPRKGRTVTVATITGRRGANKISWNRTLSHRHAKRGRYRLTLLASGGGSRASTTMSVSLR